MKALIVALILGLAVPAMSFYDNETDCSKWYDDNASLSLCRKSLKQRNSGANNHDVVKKPQVSAGETSELQEAATTDNQDVKKNPKRKASKISKLKNGNGDQETAKQ